MSQESAQRIGAERGVHLSTPSDRGPVASGARYVNKLSVPILEHCLIHYHNLRAQLLLHYAGQFEQLINNSQL
jgi:hypothetical protein